MHVIAQVGGREEKRRLVDFCTPSLDRYNSNCSLNINSAGSLFFHGPGDAKIVVYPFSDTTPEQSKGNWLVKDQRQIERFSISIPAKVGIDGESGSSGDQLLLTRDVSAAGAYFFTVTPFPVGTNVIVEMILLPQHKTNSKARHAKVTITGSVLRTDSQGMAVRFDDEYKMVPIAG